MGGDICIFMFTDILINLWINYALSKVVYVCLH